MSESIIIAVGKKSKISAFFSSRNMIIVAEIFFEYIYLNKLRLTYPEILCLIVFSTRCCIVQSAVLQSLVVCLLSVMLVDCDHIGWNSSKINSQLVSAWRSLSADPNIMDLLQGEQPEIWAQSDPPPVDLSVGDIRSQIAAEWLQIAQRSQWRAYRKPPLLFRMVPSLTPYDPTPQMGSNMPP